MRSEKCSWHILSGKSFPKYIEEPSFLGNLATGGRLVFYRDHGRGNSPLLKAELLKEKCIGP